MIASVVGCMRMARVGFCSSILAMVIAWPALAIPINHTPKLPIISFTNTTFLETDTGSVSFTVMNNVGVSLILDYALAIIVPVSGGLDDIANFTGVTANTEIAPGKPDTFTYGLNDPNGDVTDPDPGKNLVFFWVEFADAKGCGPNPTPTITVNKLGTFVFPAPKCTPPHVLDPTVLAALTACFNNPAPTVAGCQPKGALYTMYADGKPLKTYSPPLRIGQFPAVATAHVTDMPEPAGISLLVTGVLGVFAAARRRSPRAT